MGNKESSQRDNIGAHQVRKDQHYDNISGEHKNQARKYDWHVINFKLDLALPNLEIDSAKHLSSSLELSLLDSRIPLCVILCFKLLQA